MRKLSKISFAILFFSLIFSACEERSLEQDLRDRETERAPQYPYLGIWNGTYQGDDSGTLQLTINKGIGTVRRTADGGFTENFTCYIDSKGNITANSNATKFKLVGNLESKSGTWSIETLKKGTWSIKKAQ